VAGIPVRWRRATGISLSPPAIYGYAARAPPINIFDRTVALPLPVAVGMPVPDRGYRHLARFSVDCYHAFSFEYKTPLLAPFPHGYRTHFRHLRAFSHSRCVPTLAKYRYTPKHSLCLAPVARAKTDEHSVAGLTREPTPMGRTRTPGTTGCLWSLPLALMRLKHWFSYKISCLFETLASTPRPSLAYQDDTLLTCAEPASSPAPAF